MTFPTHASQADARKARWHSRRHETRDAQDEARQKYQSSHGQRARQLRAFIRRQEQVAIYRQVQKTKNFDLLRDGSPRCNNLKTAIDRAEKEINNLALKLGM